MRDLPMRVAIFQPLIPSYRLPLYERLGALPGLELTVYAGDSEGSLKACHRGTSFRVVSAPLRYWALGFRTQSAQVSLPTHRKFDLLIAPWDIHYLTVIPSVALARSMGIPIVLWGHGYSLRPHLLSDAARNLWGKMANGVLLYTGSVANQLIEECGFSRDRVFVAQNALDQAPIQAARRHWLDRPRELEDFQRSHGLDPAKTIVFLSRLEVANRIDLLLHASAALSREHPALKTVVIGDGSSRAELQLLARSLRIEDRVIFTGAIYEESKLAPWMLSGTLFCYPANIGLSLLHAFGYGLPAVTSDDRWAQNPEIEALVPDGNGLEYRSGDLNDMVRQCARILSDSALHQRLSASALQTVQDLYSMDQMVDGFKQLFGWYAALSRR
jgi:glycosyltransferase involved in cell wall biosynthesis